MKELKKFSELVFEAASKTKLDISIQAAGKYLTSTKKIEDFFNADVIIEHKTDGVKITALKIAKNGTLDDWILAYKGNIIYKGEFDFAPVTNIKKKSIGASQFKFVTDNFEKIASNAKSIPVGTELFIEFLMNKPTLSSDYSRKHGLILIAHTKSSYKEKNGLLITKPGSFDISNRDNYAKMCNLDVPALLFVGVMNSLKSFESGIINKNLKTSFDSIKNAMNWSHFDILLDDVRELFLGVESKYGGKEEGCVIKYDDVILKFQQDYQLDQEARKQIKLKYQSEIPEVEEQYWNNVRLAALEIVSNIKIKPSSELKELVQELSKELNSYKVTFTHVKRDTTNIEDDIQLTAKQILMRKLKGNNNALVLGRFQPLTKGHQKMIDLAYKECDDVYINIVKGKKSDNEKNPFSLEIQERMLKLIYPNINIISGTTGNLITSMNKINDNINWIYCGSDRVNSYENQLKKMPDVRIREIERSDDDISATEVRNSLIDGNFTRFKKLTDKKIHPLFEELSKIIKT